MYKKKQTFSYCRELFEMKSRLASKLKVWNKKWIVYAINYRVKCYVILNTFRMRLFFFCIRVANTLLAPFNGRNVVEITRRVEVYS